MYRHILALLCAATPLPATAQATGRSDPPVASFDWADQPQQRAPTATAGRVGRIGNAGNGNVGQRQRRQETAPNVEPLGRVQNRIANRVQNRIRNRIDRDYDPRANANAPFTVATPARTARTARR